MAQVREAMDRQSYEEAGEYLDLINDEMQVSEFWTHMVWFRSLLDLQRDGTSVGPATLEAKIRKARTAPLNSSGQIDLDCLRAVIHLVAGQPLKASAAVSRYTKPVPRILIVRARIALYMDDPAMALKLTGRSMDGLGPRMEVQRLMLRAAALERLGDRTAAKDNAQAAGSIMAECGLNITGTLLPQSDIAVLTDYVRAGEPGIPDPVKIIPDKVQAASLTPRELVVLNSLAVHSSANDVANALNVSVNTVKSQRRSILKKLGAKSLEEALAIARHQRLLED
jgi:LuxR family maltose regulon positive regulatory protein